MAHDWLFPTAPHFKENLSCVSLCLPVVFLRNTVLFSGLIWINVKCKMCDVSQISRLFTAADVTFVPFVQGCALHMRAAFQKCSWPFVDVLWLVNISLPELPKGSVVTCSFIIVGLWLTWLAPWGQTEYQHVLCRKTLHAVDERFH